MFLFISRFTESTFDGAAKRVASGLANIDGYEIRPQGLLSDIADILKERLEV